MTIVCVVLRTSGFDFLAKVSSLWLFIERGSVCKVNILTYFQLILLSLTESSPGSFGILKGSYHMTRGNPSDPEDSICLNLHNFKELDFPHLHPDGGGHWGRLGSCDLAWSSWWCSKPCLSYLGYDTGMLSLRSGKTTNDWWPEGKQKENSSFFTVNKGFLMFPPGMLLPTRGNLLIPSNSICCFVCKCQRRICCNLGCPLDRVRMQRMRARVFWIFVFCLALDPRQGVQTIHLPVVLLDAVSKPMFFTTIRADVLARFPCFVSEGTFEY